MNQLKNLLIWFGLDENGKPDYISKLTAIDPDLDLEANFAKWSVKTAYREANVYTFTKEHIDVPERVMAGPVSGVALIMRYHGEPLQAILPYFVVIGE